MTQKVGLLVELRTFHVNAAGIPDTMYQIFYGSPVWSYFDVFSYDSYKNPVHGYGFAFNSGDFDPSTIYDTIVFNYWYEDYWDTLPVALSSAAQHQQSPGTLTLYPNPTTGALFISQPVGYKKRLDNSRRFKRVRSESDAGDITWRKRTNLA